MPKMAPNIRRVHDVLMHSWDPLGVRSNPDAADEYERFATTIYHLLHERRSEDVLVAYLRWAAERMGVETSQAVVRPVAVELLRIEFRVDEHHERCPRVTYLRTPRQAA